MTQEGGFLPKVILYLREIQELALFTIMANKRWFMAFGSSPLFFVMMPSIAVLFTLSTMLDGIRLSEAENKNIDKCLPFAIAVICTILSSISLYGAVIAKLMGVLFPQGAMFFYSSMLLAAMGQATLLVINTRRVVESDLGSLERHYFLQSALSNLFNLAILVAALAAVYAVLLFPAASQFGSAYALTVVVFSAANMLWQILPKPWKSSIKNTLAISETVEEPVAPSPIVSVAKTAHPYRLFTNVNHCQRIRSMDSIQATQYLEDLLIKKEKSLHQQLVPGAHKEKDKLALVKDLQMAIRNRTPISKQAALKSYPLAFQSFWYEKGEVEQLFDAVHSLTSSPHLFCEPSVAIQSMLR